jgi:ribonuclease BN (tRNA processing enzyme)
MFMSTAQSKNAVFNRMPNDVNLGVWRRLHIRAAEIDHLGGVQTFGYTVEEQPPPGNIDVDKAAALGVSPSKKYSLLKCGMSVATDDGEGIVRPEEVLIRSFRPRKVAILSDHRLIFREMAQLCRNADMIVHEATLSKEDGLDVSARLSNPSLFRHMLPLNIFFFFFNTTNRK